MMSNDRIYLSPPHLTGGEQRYVQEVFASNWVAQRALICKSSSRKCAKRSVYITRLP